MSGGLCPSKSTVYVSNLKFSLTNNDLHKILEKFGKVVKVTIVKDKKHRSTGVAFALFLERESAHKCVRALDRKQLFGRTLKCSIAKDNGRTREFIRRKFYPDKTVCYECGDSGHLSYACPNNMLGEREPEKKKKKRKFGDDFEEDEEEAENSEEEEQEIEDPAEESLSAAIRYQQEKIEEEKYRIKVATGNYTAEENEEQVAKKRKFVKSDYFSDEEEVEDT